MRVKFRKRSSGEIEYGIIYGMLAISSLAAARVVPVLAIAPACLFRRMTGYPCPTCGATHALVHLAHAELAQAFTSNPLVALLLLTSALWFFMNIAGRIFSLPRPVVSVSVAEGTFLRVAAVAIVLLNWTVLLLQCR